MTGRRVLLLACLAAALTPATAIAAQPRFRKPVVALPSCSDWFGNGPSCYEPSVAVDRNGTIFVTSVGGELLSRSVDGGRRFSQLRGPVDPEMSPSPSDTILQTDRAGDLYYSTLRGDPTKGSADYIQVARSSNGGTSWDVNVDVPVHPPDRQWLAFGSPGVVYLVYRTALPSATTVMRSDDGGRTWGSEVTIPGTVITGRPAVDPGGHLYVPFIGASGIAVAVFTDDGGSFTLSEVSPEPGDFFPDLDAGPDGRLALAWLDGNDTLNVSTSSDHGDSWTTRRGIAEQVVTSPWTLVRRSGELDLAWEVRNGSAAATYHFARIPWSGQVPKPVTVATLRSFPGMTAANTDYTHFAHTSDERVIAVWSAGDTASDSSVYVALERRAKARRSRHRHRHRGVRDDHRG